MAYTTIDDPSSVFQCTLYAGDGNGSGQAITHGGNSDLQADFIWIKNRTDAENHSLTDSVRGASKGMLSNSSDAETTDNSNGYLSSFNSDGFTTANAGAYNNASSKNYVSWNWKKVAGIFDIQIYTGNGSNRTISHNLGVIPQMMIIKKRSPAGGNWQVNTAQLAANQLVELDETAAVVQDNTYFNNTRPTSSVFSLGTDGNQNTSSHTYLAYLFGNKQGVSKVGSYIGTGNADGPFIYTGFKPAFVLCKNTGNSGAQWLIVDNKRVGINPIGNYLQSNSNSAEGTGTDNFDFLSNGFKCRSTNSWNNQSGYNIIYMAFAESPFVTGASAIPTTAR